MEQRQVGFTWADRQKAVDLPDDTNRVLSVSGGEVLEQRVGVVVVQVPVLVEPSEHEVIEGDDVVARMSVGHLSIFSEEQRTDVPCGAVALIRQTRPGAVGLRCANRSARGMTGK